METSTRVETGKRTSHILWQLHSPTGRKTSLWKVTVSLFTPDVVVPSIKVSPFFAVQRLARGSPWLQTPNCSSLLTLNKPSLLKNIWQSIHFRSTHPRSHSKLWSGMDLNPEGTGSNTCSFSTKNVSHHRHA